ncbi:hypothetical protein U0070_007720 [Myodes glareolus]|uniref:Uncharacterized protein n=1 Tax=Myodes glareolus TaxID=447135 RepID=A0AAW0I6N6_MYOGA
MGFTEFTQAFRDASAVGNKEYMPYCCVVMENLNHKGFLGLRESVNNRAKTKDENINSRATGVRNIAGISLQSHLWKRSSESDSFPIIRGRSATMADAKASIASVRE